MKDFPEDTGGKPVFKHPKKNIWRSPDIDGHGGGVWKEWNGAGKNKRRTTLDDNLKPIRK